MADNIWIGSGGDKLYRQSGFTSTVKTSQSITSEDSSPSDVSYDGVNTIWEGNTFDKFWIWSGVFSTTLIDSQSHSTQANVGHCTIDNDNVPWSGNDTSTGSKLYLYSGKITGTLKDSQEVHTIDTGISGISWDGINTPWCGLTGENLYLQSGQFTSTVKTSEDIAAANLNSTGISYDGTDSPWCGNTPDKLYLQSGQFTSTIKTSVDVGAVDNILMGIETVDFTSRVAGSVSVTVLPSALTMSAAVNAPSLIININANIIIGSPLSLSLLQGAPVIPQVGFALPATLTLGLTQGVPTVIIDGTLPLSTLTLGLALATPIIYIFEPDVTLTPVTLSLGLTPHAITVSVSVALLLPGVPIPPQVMGLSIHPPEIVVTDDVRTVVANTRNFAISEYAAFAYNSMCKFNGKYLYAKADGIYEGGGDDDNGTNIDASYKTGSIDIFATEVQKLRNVFCNFRSNGDIQLFSVGDKIFARSYIIINSTADTIHERRVKLERGIRQRHFNFGVSNINGSTLEVDSIKILTEPIRKRR